MITVLSAIYGDYDGGHPAVQQSCKVDWVMVTDNPQLQLEGWRMQIEPRDHLHPRMAAKVPKCLPWRYAIEGDTVIWLDGAAAVLSPEMAVQMRTVTPAGEYAMFRHPWRQSTIDEAVASAGMPKYKGQSVIEQAEHYARCGLPPDYGMWATGCMVWRASTQTQRLQHDAFGQAWLTEQLSWTYQDQLSHPFAAWQFDMKPIDLPFGYHLDNGLVTFIPHPEDWR